MILKDIYLYPDLTKYSDEVVHPFRDQSRSICNFLERSIKPLKFSSEGFKRICFIGLSKPREECYVNSSKVLIVEVPFDETEYLGKKENNLNEYFSNLIQIGLLKARKYYSIPIIELEDSLREFKKIGYQNKWIFKEKSQKKMNITYSLNCELTINNFFSRIVISKCDNVVFDKLIVKTEPDEVIFLPLLKDIKFVDGYFSVFNKLDEVIFSVAYNDI